MYIINIPIHVIFEKDIKLSEKNSTIWSHSRIRYDMKSSKVIGGQDGIIYPRYKRRLTQGMRCG